MAKILIIDDDNDNVKIVSLVLSKDNHEIISANGAGEALEKAKTEQPDLILLDVQLPNVDGFQVCRKLKSNPHTSNIPVIFLTAIYKDSDSLVKGLELGAEGYIVKPFSTAELQARVNVMVRLKKDMDGLAKKNRELIKKNRKLKSKNKELVDIQQKLNELATTDELTGLNNRRYFTVRLEEEFLRTLRDKQPISLIMIDIDFFKKINDTYGHPCGDQVLMQFSKILKQNIRQHDIVARYGGEEFVIGMIRQDIKAAYVMAERIRQDVEENEFKFNDLMINITCSAGVGSYPETSSDAPQLEALLNEVDAALYYAKRHGRNQVVKVSILK